MIHRDEIMHFWIFYGETHFFQIQMLISTLYFKNRTKATPFQNNMDDRTSEEIYKLYSYEDKIIDALILKKSEL